jgi:hypothetical protein
LSEHGSFHLAVQTLWPLLLLPFAFLLAWFGYRRTAPPLGGRDRTLFVLLRILAFFTLLLILASPVLNLARNEPLRAHIAVLMDESASMSTQEGSGGQRTARFDRARAALRTLVDALKGDDVDVNVIPFSARAEPTLEPPAYLQQERQATGSGTDVIGALRETADRLAGENLQAIVLLSDGRTTHGDLDAGGLAALGRPVFALGLGDTLAPPDLGIDRCEYAPIAYVESETILRVRVVNSGYRGRTTRLRLLEGKRELFQRELRFEQEQGMEEIEIPVRLREPGEKRLRLELDPLENEVTERNNAREIRIEVLKSRLRVLFLAARPDWDVAFLARALREDPSFDLTLVHQNQGGHWIRSADAKPFTLPVGAAALQNYELFIIGAPGNGTPQGLWEGIAAAVEAGRGLLVLPGRESVYAQSAIMATLAPVLPLERGRNSAVQYRVEGVRTTPQGRLHPITSPLAALSDSRNVLEGIPPLLAQQGDLVAKPAAIVLLVDDAPQSQPILAVARYGNGQVAAFTAFPVWRWGFNESERFRKAHTQFIGNLARWLTQPRDVKRVQLLVSKPVYEGGESVDFMAQVLDPQFQPLEDAEVRVELRKLDGTPQTAASLLLERRAGKPGEYSGSLPGLAPGEYSAEAMASRLGAEVGRDTTRFTVEAYSKEFADTRQDVGFLREIAARTGGRYAAPEAAAELARELPRTPRPVLLHSEIEVWDTLPLFLVFVLLLSVEWLLRRQRGLL